LQNSFKVNFEKGLTGNPGDIISYGNNQLYITSLIVVLVKAKKSELSIVIFIILLKAVKLLLF